MESEKELETLSLLHEKMQNVEMILDQLARIAVAVRRSGKRSRLQKADQRFKAEEHKDLQQHLITMLSLLARPRASNEEIDPSKLREEIYLSKLSEVQQRLIHCNLKRRNRFIYAQQHSKWLDPGTAGRLSQPQTSKAIGTRPANDGEVAKEEQKSLETPVHEAADAPINPTIRTGTSASAVSDRLDLPQIPVPAASTIMSSTVIDLQYPHPPKRKETARIFTCPCCCQALPVTLSEKNRWK